MPLFRFRFNLFIKPGSVRSLTIRLHLAIVVDVIHLTSCHGRLLDYTPESVNALSRLAAVAVTGTGVRFAVIDSCL